MFQPQLIKTNPGQGIEAKFAVSGRKASDVENINVLELLECVFRDRKIQAHRHETCLELPESKLIIMPQIGGIQLMERGGVQTVTTIQIHHPTLVPKGVFEYQHSWGDTARDAITKGFDQWLKVDFVTFQDALLPKPSTCMSMEMSFPEKDGNPGYQRRAVLGPVAHFQSQPQVPSAGETAEEHPFCACCFFTNTIEAFKELIQGKEFCAIRFFAARGDDGLPQSDCRVNGDDWPDGAEALREYVKSWKGTGYEFRKQYALIQTI